MSDNLTAAASASPATNGKTKITTKDPALKLAHKRLTVLHWLSRWATSAKRAGDG